MHELTPLHFHKFCPKIEKMHGLTRFQIKVKNQRAWTNHFTFISKFWPKIERMHELTPLHFFKFEPKTQKMHGLTPLHFYKF